jgi:acyl-ACP thioesterase
MEVRRESFAVHSYEVDAFNLLAAPALAGYLQEVAGNSAAALGFGMPALMARGLTWVLARQRVEIGEPLVLGDVLEIASWPSGVDRLSALRDFEVRRQDGKVVARAATCWLVLDLRTRRPVRPDRVLDARYHDELPHALPMPSAKLPEIGSPEAEKRFQIRYQDIDVNLHVTNASYVAWAIESVPPQTWQGARLASLEAHYLAECRYGSKILSRLVREGEGGFLHAIVREEDGKELARLRTGWAPRSGGAPG